MSKNLFKPFQAKIQAIQWFLKKVHENIHHIIWGQYSIPIRTLPSGLDMSCMLFCIVIALKI